MYYAISTINDSPTGRTGYAIYGIGQTKNEADKDAFKHIGNQIIEKTIQGETLYANLRIVEENQLYEYGLK